MAYSLKSIMMGNTAMPPRVVIYGVEGIGKSTFGASFPAPIFIQTEDGLSAISVDKFPLCKSFGDIMDCIRVLSEEEHEYKTVVLDSADWTEHLIMDQVARDVGDVKYNSNHKDLAYGRGGRAIAEYWRDVIACLDYLRNEKGMGVVVIAHSQVKRFDDPTTDAYDRYLLDMNKESASLLSEWCDILGFTNFHTAVVEEKVGVNGKKKRGVSNGSRLLFTQERPAFKAKSRWSIPDKMNLDYDEFAAALAAAQSPTQ